MKFTVRDALQIEPLTRARVVGGASGLDREVRFVNIMEVPDVKKWMKGGEFLVTAGFAFQEVPELIHTILDGLDAVGVAAFGIKLGPYLQEIPKELIEHAERLAIPLIELPKDAPYMDFMIPIFENLMLRQYRVLKRVEQTHEQLIDLALRGGGITGICRSLGTMLDAPVLVVDRVGNCMTNPQETEREEERSRYWGEPIMDFFEQRVDRDKLVLQRWNRVAYDDGSFLVIVPVEINNVIESHLIAWERERAFDETNLRALEHAATVIALEIVKERAVYEHEQQIRAELLEDLIGKSFRSRELLLKRASFCRINLHSPLRVFLLDADSFDDYIFSNRIHSEEQIQRIKQELLNITRFAFLSHYGEEPLLMQRSDSIVGLINQGSSSEREALLEVLQRIRTDIVKRFPGLQTSIGVGRTKEAVETLDQSHEEARQALKVCRMLDGTDHVAFFEDLGPYSFLCDLKRSDQLANYYAETIGTLEAYDRQNNAELVKTLSTYFDSAQNIRLTADRLYLHRNSIIYRLKKIEELTGLPLNDPESLFGLQLALKMSRFMQDPREGG